MSCKLILHGFSGVALVGGGLKYFCNGSEIAEIKPNDKCVVTLQSAGELTAKLSGIRNSKNSLQIRDNTVTEVSINYSKMWGTFSLVELSTEPFSENAPNAGEDTEKPIYEFDGGLKDTLLVYDDRIVIMHRGALNAISMGVKGDKTIYYSDITSVQYKKPGFASGYIQFSIPGGNENKGGIFGATTDENSITIGNANLAPMAEKIVDFVNKKIREFKTRSVSGSATVIQQNSSADELKKFKELLDSGIITQEEFDAKKKQLLGL